jgi:hypothetical protein
MKNKKHEVNLDSIVEEVIKELKTWTKGAHHNNLWIDIIDQVQIQYSLFWDEYLKIIDGIISDKVEKLSFDKIRALLGEEDNYDEELLDSEIVDFLYNTIRGKVLGRAADEEWETGSEFDGVDWSNDKHK